MIISIFLFFKIFKINLAFMQVFEDESLCYIDQERVRYITPTFNNGSKLEFCISPNNAYSAGLESRF